MRPGGAARPADRDAHLIDEICNGRRIRTSRSRNAPTRRACTRPACNRTPARSSTDPALIGNSREVLISELAGKGSAEPREHAGIRLDEAAAARAVESGKKREHRGYQYEAADASFELLLRREAGDYEPLFRLELPGSLPRNARVGGRDRGDGQDLGRREALPAPPRATGRSTRSTAPCATRSRAHPHLADIELTNYKVRILDERHGTER